MPRVSVIIPAYNYARYICLALNSVIHQNYPNLEVLVIDDGSTDETAAVVKPYRSLVKYIYKENGGTASALNLGLRLATGKYICWLSADDMFLENKLAKQAALMESDPSLGFSYTGFRVIDAQGHKQYDVFSPYFQDKRQLVTKLTQGCFINGSTVMMRRDCLTGIGNFDESLPQAHDFDLWLRLLRHYPCGFLDEILLAYRWHGQNMSQTPDKASIEMVTKRAKQLFPEWLN